MSISPGIQVHLIFGPQSRNAVHSVSKETHHEFLGFPCDPGSNSSDPGWVIFDHRNLKQVATGFLHIVSKRIGKLKCTTKFTYLHSFQKETQLSTVRFFWDWVYDDVIRSYWNISMIWCMSFETECTLLWFGAFNREILNYNTDYRSEDLTFWHSCFKTLF